VKLNSIPRAGARGYVDCLQARKTWYEDRPRRPPDERPLSPFTIRKAVKILRGFGNWMARDGMPNPFADLDIPSVPKTIMESAGRTKSKRSWPVSTPTRPPARATSP
jgi:hypothetical protein